MATNVNQTSLENDIEFEKLTYKDIKVLTNFLSDQGKILPRRVTGLSSKQQKKVTKLIKTARIAALLPFVIGKG
jgi:small subunit ribosomal protein S18